jgi:hypothetical protein
LAHKPRHGNCWLGTCIRITVWKGLVMVRSICSLKFMSRACLFACVFVACACGGRSSDAKRSPTDLTSGDARVPDTAQPDGSNSAPVQSSEIPSHGPDSSSSQPVPGNTSDNETGVPTIPPDAATTAPDASDASGMCCPISAEPNCCMDYGGSITGGGCGTYCDGMPWPDANWKIAVNADGCPYWVEPEPRSEYDCCGCPSAPPESPDSSILLQSDAEADSGDASATRVDGATADVGLGN